MPDFLVCPKSGGRQGGDKRTEKTSVHIYRRQTDVAPNSLLATNPGRRIRLNGGMRSGGSALQGWRWMLVLSYEG